MKSGFGVVIIGVVALAVGSGVGFLASMMTMGPRAAATGMCMTVDAATKGGVLTAEQAKQLAPAAAKENTYFGSAIDQWNITIPGSSAACQQFLQAMKAQ